MLSLKKFLFAFTVIILGLSIYIITSSTEFVGKKVEKVNDVTYRSVTPDYEWIIEFDKQPNDFEKFIDVMDNTLREVNSDYDAKRFKDMALCRPTVHNAPANTFYNWLKAKDKLGGQHKVPRLANERKYIDDILEMMSASAA